MFKRLVPRGRASWLEIESRLAAAGMRVTTDLRGAKVQAKIRDAQLELIPYMLVVGPKEAETGSVAVRDRIEGDLGSMPFEQAMTKLVDEVKQKTIRQVATTTTEEPPSAETEEQFAY